MILTCPQCDTNYTLPAQALGPEGRKVRCSECGEIWHQSTDPDEFEVEDGAEEVSETLDVSDEVLKEEELDTKRDSTVAADLEDIPEAVKPLDEREDDFNKAQEKEEKPRKRITKKLVISLGLVICLFLILLLVLLKARETLEPMIPGMAVFYERVGYEEKELPGESLVFDQLKTSVVPKSRKKPALLKLEGNLINLTSKTQSVPMIEAMIRDEHEEILARWTIKPSKGVLAKEEVLHFSSDYKNLPKKAVDVNLRLLANHVEEKDKEHEEVSEGYAAKPNLTQSSKTDVKGGDSSPARH